MKRIFGHRPMCRVNSNGILSLKNIHSFYIPTSTIQQRYYSPHGKKKNARVHHKKITANQIGRSTILESGYIYFFYAPKGDEVNGIDDVNNLYMVLNPKVIGHLDFPRVFYKEQEDVTLNKRLIVIPEKHLPDIKYEDRNLNVIAKVSSSLHPLLQSLELTGTGKFHKQTRPIAEGIYTIIEHSKHTHLAYVLEYPEDPADLPVHDTFKVGKEASYVILVENPDYVYYNYKDDNANDDLILRHDHKLPEMGDEDLLKQKYMPVNPPSLLDKEGAKLLLLGSSDHLEDEFGKVGSLIKDVKNLDLQIYKGLKDEKLLEELHIAKKKHFIGPMRTGEWQ